MARSFGLVEAKIEESVFFLEKLGSIRFDFFEARCYFNAFVSATRSVTFSLQASLSDVDGFEEWYAREQELLKQDKLAKFFLDCRNDSQHVGLNPITGGAGGAGAQLLFFGQPEPERHKWLPEDDVLTACRKHMARVCLLIRHCFDKFGPIIDPNQFYTLENLTEIGWTVEDVESELGLPRGYTDISSMNVTDEDRLRMLRKHIPMSSIFPTLERYISFAQNEPKS